MKSMRMAVCAALSLLCLVHSAAYAEDAKAKLTVTVDQVISSEYPELKAYVNVKDGTGSTVSGLAPGLFQIRVDSLENKGKASIVQFPLKPEPIDYTILLSNTGIMDGEPLDFQKTAVIKFIESMRDDATLSLYVIGEEAVPVFEETAKAAIDTALVSALAVSQAQPRLYDSLLNVLRKVERRKTPRKVVIVMSDGRDQNSRFTKDQLAAVLGETGIPVNCIGFKVFTGQSLSNLNEIADLTGGSYAYASTVKALPDAMKSIAEIQTQCYLVRLKVRGVPADDLPHYLEVAVNERDSSGKGQKTFIAVKVPVPRWVKWVLLAVALVLVVAAVVARIVVRIQKRKRMGITKRKCPDCGNRMKDTWDDCPFCKYMPDVKKKKKKGKGKKDA